MAKSRHELTEGEWTILEVVWVQEPCAAPTVQEALTEQKNWAYSTVKTLMNRMVDKGLLQVEKIRNLDLYRAAISREQAQQRELQRVAIRAFGGALQPMVLFMVERAGLGEADLVDLEHLLERKRGRATKETGD